jgi:hypothetical protein
MSMKKLSEALLKAFEDFDYRVECDDFLLYELGRLIEEDDASFENEEFRRVINEGLHEHIDNRLEIRAELAWRLRRGSAEPSRADIRSALHAIEDTNLSCGEIAAVVQSYTKYLFQRLEACAEGACDEEIEARTAIERYQNGEMLREQLIGRLKTLGPAAIAPVADLLFASLDDRMTVEAALSLLESTRNAVSARILAHLISEPMLDEDLEQRAYALLQQMWPLPRHYILYSLKLHDHEDLPFPWFQLLVQCEEPSAVDRILDEIVVHADNASFREDLAALAELLRQSRDPATEEKIMHLLNAEPPQPAAEMLEAFLKTHSRGAEAGRTSVADRGMTNKKYLAAAKLLDSGNQKDAARRLEEILNDVPEYPFALMLKRVVDGES